MVEYFENGDLAFFDGLHFRRDKRTGYFLNSTIRKRLHVYVWEHYNGKVPKGHHVHHKDFDKNNNEIENLVLMSASEHQKLHGDSWDEERKEYARENLIDNARPKASEWHRSEEGRKWHSEHGKTVYANLPTRKFICSFCGKEFETKHNYKDAGEKFCSDKCVAANRRKKRVDYVEKICERCGNPYISNKYVKTRWCKYCKSRKDREIPKFGFKYQL